MENNLSQEYEHPTPTDTEDYEKNFQKEKPCRECGKKSAGYTESKEKRYCFCLSCYESKGKYPEYYKKIKKLLKEKNEK